MGELALYPNAARGYIYILPPGLASAAEYAIATTEGRVVMKGALTPQRSRINIEHLQAGVYVFTVYEGGKETGRGKFEHMH